MKRQQVSGNLLEFLRETGHWVNSPASLPKRGGHHYEAVRFTPEICIDWALYDYFAQARCEHWYADGRKVYLLVEDQPEGATNRPPIEKAKISYEELFSSIRGMDEGYGKYSQSSRDQHRYPSTDSPGVLDLEDEQNRKRFRYARHKDEIDRLIKIREELKREKESAQSG